MSPQAQNTPQNTPQNAPGGGADSESQQIANIKARNRDVVMAQLDRKFDELGEKAYKKIEANDLKPLAKQEPPGMMDQVLSTHHERRLRAKREALER